MFAAQNTAINHKFPCIPGRYCHGGAVYPKGAAKRYVYRCRSFEAIVSWNPPGVKYRT